PAHEQQRYPRSRENAEGDREGDSVVPHRVDNEHEGQKHEPDTGQTPGEYRRLSFIVRLAPAEHAPGLSPGGLIAIILGILAHRATPIPADARAGTSASNPPRQ